MVSCYAELAQSNECIHMLHFSFQKTQVAPRLWRDLVRQTACEAIGSNAGRTVEPEENMDGTDQPIFMHRLKLDALTIS